MALLTKKSFYYALTSGLVLVGLAHADPPAKIDMPDELPAAAQVQDAPAAEPDPISNTVTDLADRHWKLYDNYIVKIHVRVKTAWNVMEMKETKKTGIVSFTLSRPPGPLATFSVTREAMDGPFEAWVSSASLTTLYPGGYKESHASFAGRKGLRVQGTVKDGRLEESYFAPDGAFITQVSFSAPADAWKDIEPEFTALKQSFHWL